MSEVPSRPIRFTAAPSRPAPSVAAPSGPAATAPDSLYQDETDVAASPAAVRPQVLALPSTTASRSIVLMFALLSSGLFVGNAIHHSTSVGDTWFRTVSACFAAFGNGPQTVAGVVSSGPDIQRCTAHVNTVLIWFQIGGIVLAALLCVGLVWSAPAQIIRFRGLRVPAPGLIGCVDRVGRLAVDAGLHRPPRVWIGRTDQRDAFTFGRPRRYAISLPPALAVRSRYPDQFDPVIRHELQHIRRRDVMLAWTALVSRWALIPLLCVPIVFELAHGDTSVLPSYVWRAALLAVTGLLASAAVLRAREFEADLGSARDPQQRRALNALLGSAQPTIARWRRLIAAHPSRARRRLTLDEPIVLTRVGGVEGFVVGLLSALTMPMVTAFLADSSSLARWSAFAGPLTAGALLGVTVGFGTWRAALAHRALGRRPPPARPLLIGVFAGFLLGQTSSLAQVGSAGLVGFDHSASILINPIGAVSATALVVASAALFADTAPALGRRLSALMCLAVSGGLFVSALWLTNITQPIWGRGGWAVLRVTVVTLFGTTGHVVLVGIIAALVLVMVALGSRSTVTPTWAYDGPAPDKWPSSSTRPSLGAVLLAGVLAGIGGGFAIAVYRWQAGPASDSAHAQQRADAYLWVFALSGIAAMVVLALRYRGSGIAAGLGAGPIAATVAGVFFVLLNTALGGSLTWTFTSAMVRGGLGAYCGLLIPLGIAWCLVEALRPVRELLTRPHPAAAAERMNRGWTLVTVAAAALVLGAALSGALIADREQISPLAADRQDVGSLPISRGSSTGPTQPSRNGGSSTTQSTPKAIANYRDQFAPQVEKLLTLLDSNASAIAAQTGLTGHQIADLINTNLITPTQQLMALSAAHQADGEPIRSANQQLLAGLADRLSLYQAEAAAFSTGASSLPASAQADAALAREALAEWEQAVAALH
jgi:Zn-dependent protease with chaperone function